jgi:ribosome-associated protein
MEFELEGHDYIELCDLLKVTGLCSSGGEAKIRIAEGEVQVENALETRKRCKIRSGQTVEFAGECIRIV